MDFDEKGKSVANDICPRCVKSVSDTENNTGCLRYYQQQCKSTKCNIHRSRRRRNSKSYSKRKRKIEKKNYHRIPINKSVKYQVEEFDFIEYDIDPALYSKIEKTVGYVSDKKMSLKNMVGNESLKEIIQRTIIWPLKKPEVFKGLRTAPKGVLLFGPPGTGKTFLGQCIAYETRSTFFNISASILTSRYMGECEKLVKTMFLVAKARQPSVILIDEIDSFLAKRTPEENGSSRRMKNEFFVFMDGSATEAEDRIMIIGSTNRPQELDEAARRRFFKRIYVPLPDHFSRKEFISKLLERECHSLGESEINDIVNRTEGFSLSDLKNLSQEAAMGPVKTLSPDALTRLKPEKLRPITMADFFGALKMTKPTVTRDEIKTCEEWDSKYGYGSDNSDGPLLERRKGNSQGYNNNLFSELYIM